MAFQLPHAASASLQHLAAAYDREAVRPSKSVALDTAGFQQGDFVQASHGKINYKLWRSGEGPRPLVVTLHGLLGTMRTFAGMAQDLMHRGYDVLTFDLFGFGLSDSPKRRFNAELFAEQTLELLSLLGFPEDFEFILVGFSMGGVIAMELARCFPERVSKLLLIAPAGLVPLSSMERAAIRTLRAARALRIPAATWLSSFASGFEFNTESFEPDMGDSPNASAEAEKNAVMFRSDPAKYTKAWLKSVRDMQLGGNSQLYEELARSGVEVMFLWGDSDSTIPLADIQEELRRCFPTAPVLLVQGAGHGMLADQHAFVAHYAACWFQRGAAGLTEVVHKQKQRRRRVHDWSRI